MKFGQTQLDVTRRRPRADDDIEREIFHGGIEYLFDGPSKPVDLINEENIALAQIREDGRQVAGFLDSRAGCHLQIGVHFAGENMAERRFAQAGRAIEQHMIQRFIAFPRCLHLNLDFVA